MDTEGSSSKGLTEVDLSLIGRARVLHSETRAGVEVDDLLDEREACRNHGLKKRKNVGQLWRAGEDTASLLT